MPPGTRTGPGAAIPQRDMDGRHLLCKLLAELFQHRHAAA